jgi:hypothetical protein
MRDKHYEPGDNLRKDTAKSTWGLHDLVKTQYSIFNGYGHIHQDYRKVDGEWKITPQPHLPPVR